MLVSSSGMRPMVTSPLRAMEESAPRSTCCRAARQVDLCTVGGAKCQRRVFSGGALRASSTMRLLIVMRSVVSRVEAMVTPFVVPRRAHCDAETPPYGAFTCNCKGVDGAGGAAGAGHHSAALREEISRPCSAGQPFFSPVDQK